MTTIAYDGQYIAADGLACGGDMIYETDFKKFKKLLKFNNAIVGCCGTAADIEIFAENYYPKEFTNMQLNSCGIGYCSEVGVFVCGVSTTNEFYIDVLNSRQMAVGSGGKFAIAALDHGASAIDAVRYASTRDLYTGGVITTFDTRTQKFKRYKK